MKLPQTLNIQEQKVKLVENDVHLALTVVDTPGKSQFTVARTQCPRANLNKRFLPRAKTTTV